MITPELIKYIREQTTAGVSRDAIASTLTQHGWSSQDITGAFLSLTPRSVTASAVATNPINTKPVVRELPANHGRKLALSFGFIAISLVYGFSRYAASAAQPSDSTVVAVADTSASGTSIDTTATAGADTSNVQTTTPTPTPVKVPSKAPTPAPVQTPVVIPTPPPVATKPKGQYTDGSYIGTVSDAYYGSIQVKAVITNGALSDVVFLQYPNDRRNSIQINSRAMPELKQEAISAQSASINGVSGATYSSQAFVESLSSALSQAKA